MKILSIILGVALIAVGGMAIHFSRSADAAHQRIATLEAQLQERQARTVASATPPPALSMPPTQPPRPAASGAPATAAPVAASVPAAQSALAEIEAMMRLQMSSPEGMARRRESARQLMRTTNPGLEEALELNPQETERLLDLLAAQQDKSSSVFENARQAADPEAARRQVAASLEEIRQGNEAELQELLGSKYAQWKDYEQTRTAWAQRRDLRAVLDMAGVPLTAAQDRPLVNALAAEYRTMRQAQQAGGNAVLPSIAERHQRLLGAASPHLSAQQLEGYRQMLDRAALQEQSMQDRFRRAADAAGASPAAPAN